MGGGRCVSHVLRHCVQQEDDEEAGATDLIEVLFKLRCIIIDVINVDGDVSSCCVPTVRYLQHCSGSSNIKSSRGSKLIIQPCLA